MRRLLVPVVAAIALGCSSAEDAAGSDDELIGGTAAGAQFPATVRLVLPSGAKCGAAKLGRRRFLTASHCITHGGVEVGATLDIVRGVPEKRTSATVTRAVASPFEAEPPGPGASELSKQSGLDIAIMEVDADTADVAVAKLDRTPQGAGNQVVVSGTGCQSDAFGAGLPHSEAGTLKFGIVRIASVEKYHYYLPKTDVDGKETRVCQGDSGTPLYKNDKDSRGRYLTVVGVNSFRAPSVQLWGAAARIDRNVPANAERWLSQNGVFDR